MAVCCAVLAIRGNGILRQSWIFLGLTLALSIVPQFISESGGYLVGRLWIAYWPIFCLPLMAVLVSRVTYGKWVPVVLALFASGLAFLFVQQINLDSTVAWSGEYEDVSQLFSELHQGNCFEKVYVHMTFYIEKLQLTVERCPGG